MTPKEASKSVAARIRALADDAAEAHSPAVEELLAIAEAVEANAAIVRGVVSGHPSANGPMADLEQVASALAEEDGK